MCSIQAIELDDNLQIGCDAQLLEADLAAWNTKKRPSHKAAFMFVDSTNNFGVADSKGVQIQRTHEPSSHGHPNAKSLTKEEQDALVAAGRALQVTVQFEERKLTCSGSVQKYTIMSLVYGS